jgi:hypothetical protein
VPPEGLPLDFSVAEPHVNTRDTLGMGRKYRTRFSRFCELPGIGRHSANTVLTEVGQHG